MCPHVFVGKWISFCNKFLKLLGYEIFCFIGHRHSCLKKRLSFQTFVVSLKSRGIVICFIGGTTSLRHCTIFAGIVHDFFNKKGLLDTTRPSPVTSVESVTPSTAWKSLTPKFPKHYIYPPHPPPPLLLIGRTRAQVVQLDSRDLVVVMYLLGKHRFCRRMACNTILTVKTSY